MTGELIPATPAIHVDYAVLAVRVETDAQGRINLIGVHNSYFVSKYPHLTKFVLAVRVNARREELPGKPPFVTRITVRHEDGAIEHDFDGPVLAGDTPRGLPFLTMNINVEMSPFEIRRPGGHTIELRVNGVHVASARFTATPTVRA